MNNIILSISDSVNLSAFGKSFIHSSILNKNNTHIHVINMSKKDKFFLDGIKSQTSLLSYSNSNIDFSNMNEEKTKQYFIFLKYKIFVEFLKMNKKFVVFYADINSIIRRSIIPPVQDIGIFKKKDYTNDSMKNIATIFYSNIKGIDYWEKVCEVLHQNIIKNNFVWFFEQKIILNVYQTLNNTERVLFFSRKYCDWKCDTYSPVWTSKGLKKNYKDLSLTFYLFKTSTKNEREEYDIMRKQEYYNDKFINLKVFYENKKIL